jgi:hypothetical protein
MNKQSWLLNLSLLKTHPAFRASIIHSTLPTRQELKSPFTVMVRPLKMTPIFLFLSVQTVLNANWK